MESVKSGNLKTFIVSLGWFVGLCKSNVSPLLKRDLKVDFKVQFYVCTLKCEDSKECWRKIGVAPLSLSFCIVEEYNFIGSFLYFFPIVVTNLLLIVVIPTWSKILFTPASALISQPTHRVGFFLHTSKMEEIQRMNNWLPWSNLL